MWMFLDGFLCIILHAEMGRQIIALIALIADGRATLCNLCKTLDHWKLTETIRPNP